MKNWIIIILLASTICLILWEIYKPDHIPDSGKTNALQDSLKRLQSSKDLLSLQVKHLTHELSASRAAVKLSENKLSNTKDNERVALKAKKQAVLKMTDDEAKEDVKRRYQSDPDSIDQKVDYDLERLSWCDSIRAKSDSVLQNYRKQTVQIDSLNDKLASISQVSQDQISLLNSSLSSKDTEIKKLKRRNRLLKVIAPLAFLVGVLIVI